jgi:hypothetical protein
MQMPKATDSDKDRFRALVPDSADVEIKPMFGQLGAFVNGNMFAGMFGSSIGVKLSPDDAAELAERPGSGPFGPEERPMGGWLSLPESMGEQEATEWVTRAHTHIATLPPKRKK